MPRDRWYSQKTTETAVSGMLWLKTVGFRALNEEDTMAEHTAVQLLGNLLLPLGASSCDALVLIDPELQHRLTHIKRRLIKRNNRNRGSAWQGSTASQSIICGAMPSIEISADTGQSADEETNTELPDPMPEMTLRDLKAWNIALKARQAFRHEKRLQESDWKSSFTFEDTFFGDLLCPMYREVRTQLRELFRSPSRVLFFRCADFTRSSLELQGNVVGHSISRQTRSSIGEWKSCKTLGLTIS
eukprot:284815431_1